MILLFPQATLTFNNLVKDMIDADTINIFLAKSFDSYDFTGITKVVLIILKDTHVECVLREFLLKSKSIKEFEIVVIEKETSGSICSILMATPLLKNETIVISALDQIIIGKKLNICDLIKNNETDVIVPTYISEDPLLCYALSDEANKVIQLFEKKRVSSYAICGIYIIQDYSTFFRHCYELLIKYRGFQNRTFYTSDVINSFINQNAKCNFPQMDLPYIKVRSKNDMGNI
jgi:dTDP-glucose pyrophosphorylase